jgi:hypothetical protein
MTATCRSQQFTSVCSVDDQPFLHLKEQLDKDQLRKELGDPLKGLNDSRYAPPSWEGVNMPHMCDGHAIAHDSTYGWTTQTRWSSSNLRPRIE